MLAKHQLRALADISVVFAFHKLLYAQTGFFSATFMKELKMCSPINFTGCVESISEYYVLALLLLV